MCHGRASRGHTRVCSLTSLPCHQLLPKRIHHRAATALTVGAMASQLQAMPGLAMSSRGPTLVPRWSCDPLSWPPVSPRPDLAELWSVLCSASVNKEEERVSTHSMVEIQLMAFYARLDLLYPVLISIWSKPPTGDELTWPCHARSTVATPIARGQYCFVFPSPQPSPRLGPC
jgi:hypothetical protein